MKTLANPCKIVLEGYRRQGNTTKVNHRREDVTFWPSKRLVTTGFLRIVSAKYKGINPIAASSSTPSLSPEPQTLETEDQETYQMRKRVHVKFQFQKECSFGEQFMIVGDDSMLGLWNPADAIPMQWSDGHVWTVELDVPADETIQYKFILKGIDGTISWQPGPDRILKTWDTGRTIFVWEDWGNAALQKMMEDEPSAHDGAGNEITSEILIDADILTRQDGDIDSKVGNGSVTGSMEDPIMNTNNGMSGESSLETNGRVPLAAKSSSMDVEESPITSEEEEAVLVPGLSPVLESFNVERSVAFDASLGVNEVMDHHLPEPDEKHEIKNDQRQMMHEVLVERYKAFSTAVAQMSNVTFDCCSTSEHYTFTA